MARIVMESDDEFPDINKLLEDAKNTGKQKRLVPRVMNNKNPIQDAIDGSLYCNQKTNPAFSTTPPNQKARRIKIRSLEPKNGNPLSQELPRMGNMHLQSRELLRVREFSANGICTIEIPAEESRVNGEPLTSASCKSKDRLMQIRRVLALESQHAEPRGKGLEFNPQPSYEITVFDSPYVNEENSYSSAGGPKIAGCCDEARDHKTKDSLPDASKLVSIKPKSPLWGSLPENVRHRTHFSDQNVVVVAQGQTTMERSSSPEPEDPFVLRL